MGYTTQTYAQLVSYTPTVTGFSSTTVCEGTYQLHGKLCTVAILILGTSNATGFTFTLPFNPDPAYIGGDAGNSKYAQIVYALNNSGGIGTALARTRTGSSNIVDMYTSAAGAAWTAANTKGVYVTFNYLTE